MVKCLNRIINGLNDITNLQYNKSNKALDLLRPIHCTHKYANRVFILFEAINAFYKG